VGVKDTIAPVIPVLPDVNVSFCNLPFTPTRPTTTDNCAGIVTGTTTTAFPLTAVGTTTVTWSFSDGHGNTVTANQKIIINGYTFVGFYSPISAIGGDCHSPAKNIKGGSVIPIKFDVKCGSTLVTSGIQPVVKVQSVDGNCNPTSTLLSVNAVYQNDWHANWDTSNWAPGIYKIVVLLPDGTMPYVFVNLK
jgi:hypothetical protein